MSNAHLSYIACMLQRKSLVYQKHVQSERVIGQRPTQAIKIDEAKNAQQYADGIVDPFHVTFACQMHKTQQMSHIFSRCYQW